ncbi:hypothetical protein NBRC116597_32210 [Phaeobacter sp. NW0010-22]
MAIKQGNAKRILKGLDLSPKGGLAALQLPPGSAERPGISNSQKTLDQGPVR